MYMSVRNTSINICNSCINILNICDSLFVLLSVYVYVCVVGSSSTCDFDIVVNCALEMSTEIIRKFVEKSQLNSNGAC